MSWRAGGRPQTAAAREGAGLKPGGYEDRAARVAI